MSQFQFHRPLVIAMVLGVGALTLAPLVQAQVTNKGMTAREQEQRAREMSRTGQDPSAQSEEGKETPATPSIYPNATRQQPTSKATPRLMSKLKKMQEKYDHEDWAGVIADADAIAGSSDAQSYDKSYAYSMAGNAAANLDQQAKAAEYFAKAIAANGLDNDSHYAAMYNLAVIQFGEEKYADALATIDRFLAETKSDKVETLAFRAGILASLDRNDEAAAIYQDLVAKNPGDKKLLMNAVAALQGAGKFDKANDLLEAAYKRGQLTEEREYRALYVGYMNAKRWKDAQAVIEAGLTKGILQANPDTGRAFLLLAQNAFYEQKTPDAIAFYTRAAPMLSDGEGYLNLAKLLAFTGRKAEAKEAARQALAKGVKNPEEANKILAR